MTPSKATFGDLVRKYFPDANEDYIDHILWNLTAFPFCGIRKLHAQLRHLRDVGEEQVHAEIELQYEQVYQYNRWKDLKEFEARVAWEKERQL